MENLEADAFIDPFPHLIIKNFYNDDELELIWEELKFYTKPGKLLTAKDFGGVVKKTCLLYTSPSPRDRQKSRMPSSA